jgi:hypothetical protein
MRHQECMLAWPERTLTGRMLGDDVRRRCQRLPPARWARCCYRYWRYATFDLRQRLSARLDRGCAAEPLAGALRMQAVQWQQLGRSADPLRDVASLLRRRLPSSPPALAGAVGDWSQRNLALSRLQASASGTSMCTCSQRAGTSCRCPCMRTTHTILCSRFSRAEVRAAGTGETSRSDFFLS